MGTLARKAEVEGKGDDEVAAEEAEEMGEGAVAGEVAFVVVFGVDVQHDLNLYNQMILNGIGE